ncbi:PQQ-like beta-propeller repeat protein [bacterium]|nr:PQQ-like beta-propeller repeat protein [bacterium]
MKTFLRLFSFVILVPLAQGALGQLPGRELWQVDTQDPVKSLIQISDLTVDGLPDVVAGTEGNMVFVIESSTGDEWWSYLTDGTVHSLAAIGDVDGLSQEDVLAGTALNSVYCMSGESDGYGGGVVIWKDPSLGADIWSLSTIGDIPTSGDGLREGIAGLGNGRVLCLSGADGTELWSATVSNVVWTVASCPSVNADAIEEVIVGTGGNRLYLLDGATGQELWSLSTSGDVWTVGWLPDINSDGAPETIAGTADDTVYCISGKSVLTGTMLWSFPTESDVWRVVPVPDRLGPGQHAVAVATNGTLVDTHLLRASTGTEIWSTGLAGGVHSLATTADATRDRRGDLVCGTKLSTVDGLDGRDGGHFWRYPAQAVGTINGLVALPDLTGDGLDEVVAGSQSGIVSCLEGILKPLPPASTVQWDDYR